MKITLQKTVFVFVILIFLGYGVSFIMKTSFVQDGKRYFCLFDDAMISMAYAKNVVNGYGLNWAKNGDAVEGFTHPLWTFMMIPLQLIPVGDHVKSLFVQLISLFFYLGALWFIKRLTEVLIRRELSFIWLLPVILTAFYYPLVNWSLQGMETALQALMVASVFYLVMKEKTGNRFSLVTASVIMALGLILRMDMLLLVLCVFGYWVFFQKLSLKQLIPLALIVFVPFVLYLIFRWVYFHDFLPNTYYLKMTGISTEVRVLRGLDVFGKYMISVLPAVVFTLLMIALFVRQAEVFVLFAFICVQFSYSVYVGGDAWEWSSVGANRFVSFAMPVFFVALTVALHQVFVRYSFFKKNIIKVIAFIIVLSFSFCSFNALLFTEGAGEKWNNLTLKNPPLHFVYHYYMVEKVKKLNEITTEDAVVATVQAGICAYYAHFKLTDIMGYNDRFIAKGPTYFPLNKNNYNEFIPGHVKLNYDYTIKVVKPDVIYDTWGIHRPEIKAKLDTLLPQYYFKMTKSLWIRKGSPNVKMMKVGEFEALFP